MNIETAKNVSDIMNELNRLQDALNSLNASNTEYCDLYSQGRIVCTLEKDEVEGIIRFYTEKIRKLESEIESL